MEKVFWLMWLADLAGSIGLIGCICLFAFGLGMGLLLFTIGLEEGSAPFVRAWKVGRWLLIPIGIAVMTPGTKTIQMLAVASAADAVATTALGAKGLQAVDAILDRVIGEAKPKK